MDEGAQMTIADLIGRFSSSKVNSVLKQLQQSDYPLFSLKVERRIKMVTRKMIFGNVCTAVVG